MTRKVFTWWQLKGVMLKCCWPKLTKCSMILSWFGCWAKNRGGKTPQIIPFVHRVFHEINHPFWGVSPYFWIDTHLEHKTKFAWSIMCELVSWCTCNPAQKHNISYGSEMVENWGPRVSEWSKQWGELTLLVKTTHLKMTGSSASSQVSVIPSVSWFEG